jgi:hypothetical protein
MRRKLSCKPFGAIAVAYMSNKRSLRDVDVRRLERRPTGRLGRVRGGGNGSRSGAGPLRQTGNRLEAQLRQEHKHRLNKEWIVVRDHDPSVLLERYRDPLSLSVRDAGVRYVRPRQADRKLAEGAKGRS